jgi:hypothetical protein
MRVRHCGHKKRFELRRRRDTSDHQPRFCGRERHIALAMRTDNRRRTINRAVLKPQIIVHAIGQSDPSMAIRHSAELVDERPFESLGGRTRAHQVRPQPGGQEVIAIAGAHLEARVGLERFHRPVRGRSAGPETPATLENIEARW